MIWICNNDWIGPSSGRPEGWAKGVNALGSGLGGGSDAMHTLRPMCPPLFLHVLEGWSCGGQGSHLALWRSAPLIVRRMLCLAVVLHSSMYQRGRVLGSQLASPLYIPPSIRRVEHSEAMILALSFWYSAGFVDVYLLYFHMPVKMDDFI